MLEVESTAWSAIESGRNTNEAITSDTSEALARWLPSKCHQWGHIVLSQNNLLTVNWHVLIDLLTMVHIRMSS